MRIALVGAECEENLAMRYISGTLERDGHEVIIIPFNNKADSESAAAALAASGAQLAGFSMVFTYRAREFAMLAERTRQLGYNGHLVAGGHFAAFHAEQLLNQIPAFDSIAIGEGETIMADLAASLDSPGNVSGLVWRHNNGEIRCNSPALNEQDLDTLACPTRKTPPDSYLGLPIANMLSSRGCTHSCAFCSISAWHKLCGGARFRLRSPEAVAQEMAQLYWRGYRIFNFHDDNFFLRGRKGMPERMQQLKKELESRNVGKIVFAVKSRPDSMDEGLLSMMKEMGLFRVFVGIEAGTGESLNNLGRRQSLDDNERALELLNRFDIHTCFNLLLLNPDSTIEDVQGNVQFLRKHHRNPMNFCRTEVYAGTPLEQRLRETGRLQGSLWGYGYKIADSRAQAMFELMNEVMWERHHSDDNLHHLAMRVDYERQLLSRFFSCERKLARQVTGFISSVNLNSCGYLEELIDAASRGFASDSARTSFVSGVKSRMLADNCRLEKDGLSLLMDIRQAAGFPCHERHSGWHQTAASVGLATTLTLLSLKDAISQDNHMKERVALPARVEPEDNPMVKPDKQPPDGSASSIRSRITSYSTIRRIAALVKPAQSIDIEIWTGDNGKTTYVAILKSGAKPEDGNKVTDEQKKKLPALIEKLGATGFKDREKAKKDIMEIGSAAVPEIKKAMASSGDPEIQERCKEILKTIDSELDIPKKAELINVIRSIRLSSSSANKRFIITITKEELEAALSNENTHIFEMAPGPLD